MYKKKYIEIYSCIQNYKKSPGQRPNGVSDLAPRGFSIDSSISLIISRRPGTPDPPNPCVDVPRATPGCSKDSFSQIFRRPKATSKNQRFLGASKIDQNGTLNRPWCARGSPFDEET